MAQTAAVSLSVWLLLVSFRRLTVHFLAPADKAAREGCVDRQRETRLDYLAMPPRKH